ncbi:hypothetical protein Q5P01_022452 [Channa striata]|uniref:Uncharacterized protein n=1 Tax=Channa striata TaxID=64152 RepID=A0AA88LMK1_CHASR|nr:hypothetical protein Q5P01_022452 [Channa striata]
MKEQGEKGGPCHPLAGEKPEEEDTWTALRVSDWSSHGPLLPLPLSVGEEAVIVPAPVSEEIGTIIRRKLFSTRTYFSERILVSSYDASFCDLLRGAISCFVLVVSKVLTTLAATNLHASTTAVIYSDRRSAEANVTPAVIPSRHYGAPGSVDGSWWGFSYD